VSLIVRIFNLHWFGPITYLVYAPNIS